MSERVKSSARSYMHVIIKLWPELRSRSTRERQNSAIKRENHYSSGLSCRPHLKLYTNKLRIPFLVSGWLKWMPMRSLSFFFSLSFCHDPPPSGQLAEWQCPPLASSPGTGPHRWAPRQQQSHSGARRLPALTSRHTLYCERGQEARGGERLGAAVVSLSL